jgi:hypothetical protein
MQYINYILENLNGPFPRKKHGLPKQNKKEMEKSKISL